MDVDDFSLFPSIKEKLCGIHYSIPEKAVNAFKELGSAVSKKTGAAYFT